MTRHGRHSTRTRGFTLVEIVVAVGILALVGVIIGTIFATVGETVSRGQRVSNMNRFALRIERIMRRDFENMIRENAFLVIRNEISHEFGGNPPRRRSVPLTATDTTFPGNDDDFSGSEPGRPRRIDEIMFFSRGDFTSRRTAIDRDLAARSNVARVYYGHGQRMPEDFGANPDRPDFATRYARPRLDEPNNFRSARLGEPSALGQVNPNEFASDWTLLRQETLLVPRRTGLQELPDEVFGLRPNETGVVGVQAYNRLSDSSRQIGLNPAAQGVFRAVAGMTPYELSHRTDSPALVAINPPGFTVRSRTAGMAALVGGSGSINDPAGLRGVDETLARPLFTSGLIDVAVTDLDEIRTTVTRTWFSNPGQLSAVERLPRSFTPYDYSLNTDRLGFERARSLVRSDFGETIEAIGTVLATGALGGGIRQAQQLWMLDALPSVPYDPASASFTGFRARYEPSPPRAFLDDGVALGATATDLERRLQLAIEQADQDMLASSIFLPRCTEFIVEWSFGIIDRRRPGTNPNYGQPIWHGLRRYEDGNGNNRYDEGGRNATSPDRLFADLFGTRFDGADLIEDPARRDNDFNIRSVMGGWFFEDGNPPRNPLGETGIDLEMVQLVRVDQRFAPPSDPENAVAAEYCFGYVYRDANNTPGDASDDTIRPWPWPRLIRVTMRFVDPSDLTTERTYQAEFRVPALAEEM